MLFEYLNEKNYSQLIISGYSAEVLNYFRPNFHKFANKSNVKIFDKNKVEF